MTNVDRTFHDTYYVVGHNHYLLSLLAIVVFFALAWLAILRLSSRLGRKHASLATAALALGSFFSLAPLAAILITDPVHTDFTLFTAANQIAIIGILIVFMTLLATAALLIGTIVAAIRRR